MAAGCWLWSELTAAADSLVVWFCLSQVLTQSHNSINAAPSSRQGTQTAPSPLRLSLVTAGHRSTPLPPCLSRPQNLHAHPCACLVLLKVTDAPAVHSRGFHVEFDLRAHKDLGYILPTWKPLPPPGSLPQGGAMSGSGSGAAPATTRITLPLREGAHVCFPARTARNTGCWRKEVCMCGVACAYVVCVPTYAKRLYVYILICL